jgi:hypothetical protein
MAMDRGVWATWYDLEAAGKHEYLDWLHGEYLPSMLRRPGYLWGAHVENVTAPEREERSARRLTRTTDPSVPDGFQYLLIFGALSPHVFADSSPREVLAELDDAARSLLGRRRGERSSIFVEADRVEGPDAGTRRPGITPGPVIQFGSFNSNTPDNETEISTWYARSRLPLVQPLAGTVGARKLVGVSGWARHAILYEFSSLEAAEKNLVDPSDWTRRVVDNLVHAPHSPSLGVRIWPPLESA